MYNVVIYAKKIYRKKKIFSDHKIFQIQFDTDKLIKLKLSP